LPDEDRQEGDDQRADGERPAGARGADALDRLVEADPR
jgi:hypothetical protein